LGEGPGEYNEPLRFSCADSSLFISVVGKVLQYSYTGKFLKEFKTPISSRDFAIIPSTQTIVFYSGYYDAIAGMTSYNLNITDEYGKVIYSALPFPSHVLSENLTLLYNNFSVTQEELFFTDPYCDTLYQVLPDRVIPRIVLDFGSAALPNDFIEKYLTDRDNNARAIRELMETKYAKKWSSAKHTTNHINLTYGHKSRIYSFFFDKENKVIKYADERNTPYSSGLLPYRIGGNQWSSTTCLIGLVDPYQLKLTLENDQLRERVSKYNLNYPEENVILRLTYLKKFE
jgi:hypothetical protein